MLTEEFVCGYVTALGSFIEYHQKNKTYFAFQIKTSLENELLLNQIVSTLSIHNRVYKYRRAKQSYCELIIRDRHSLQNTIIPYFSNKLEGFKKLQFEDWKNRFLKNSSVWNYRNIKSTSNPQPST
jgi:hypothetical protein